VIGERSNAAYMNAHIANNPTGEAKKRMRTCVIETKKRKGKWKEAGHSELIMSGQHILNKKC